MIDSPGGDGRHPLQPGQAPRRGLSPPDGRRPRRPLPQRHQGLRLNDPDANVVRYDQPLAAGEGRPPGQALAAQEADRLVHRGHRPDRVPPVRRGRHPRVEQGVREDRLPRRDRGPLAGAGPRRVRPRGHQLLHVPLDHHQQHLRHVLPPVQPDHRRDDRRRRDLRRELDPGLEDRIRPAHRRPPPRPHGQAAADARWPSARSSARSWPRSEGFGQLDLGLGAELDGRQGQGPVARSRPSGRASAATCSSGWPNGERASCRFSTGMQARAGPGRAGDGRRRPRPSPRPSSPRSSSAS